MYRSSRFLLIMTASLLAWLSLLFAGALRAQDSTPLSGAWNIASSGTAGSSGELLFRLTPADGGDPPDFPSDASGGAGAPASAPPPPPGT